MKNKSPNKKVKISKIKPIKTKNNLKSAPIKRENILKTKAENHSFILKPLPYGNLYLRHGEKRLKSKSLKEK